MGKLDGNLDAYRIAAQILHRLRHIVRHALTATHGEEWPRTSPPTETLQFLGQRQAREASINWHLADSTDVLDFAGFADLHEVIAASPALMARFAPLAADPNVLRIRFLELDTILGRLAYIRPVSEADLGFLASFADRLKRTVVDSQGGQPRSEEIQSPAVSFAAEAVQEAAEPALPPSSGTATAPAPLPAVVPAANRRQRGAAPAAAPAAGEPVPAPEATDTSRQRGVMDLDKALASNDDAAVMRQLYEEITPIADGLWNSSVSSPQPKVWERVRESAWYQERFTPLGLRAVSDFFDLFEAAKQRIVAGGSRTELQEFLKERQFAQALLALRAVFRKALANQP